MDDRVHPLGSVKISPGDMLPSGEWTSAVPYRAVVPCFGRNGCNGMEEFHEAGAALVYAKKLGLSGVASLVKVASNGLGDYPDYLLSDAMRSIMTPPWEARASTLDRLPDLGFVSAGQYLGKPVWQHPSSKDLRIIAYTGSDEDPGIDRFFSEWFTRDATPDAGAILVLRQSGDGYEVHTHIRVANFGRRWKDLTGFYLGFPEDQQFALGVLARLSATWVRRDTWDLLSSPDFPRTFRTNEHARLDRIAERVVAPPCDVNDWEHAKWVKNIGAWPQLLEHLHLDHYMVQETFINDPAPLQDPQVRDDLAQLYTFEATMTYSLSRALLPGTHASRDSDGLDAEYVAAEHIYRTSVERLYALNSRWQEWSPNIETEPGEQARVRLTLPKVFGYPGGLVVEWAQCNDDPMIIPPAFINGIDATAGDVIVWDGVRFKPA
jgi:hypothetical protein